MSEFDLSFLPRCRSQPVYFDLKDRPLDDTLLLLAGFCSSDIRMAVDMAIGDFSGCRLNSSPETTRRSDEGRSLVLSLVRGSSCYSIPHRSPASRRGSQ